MHKARCTCVEWYRLFVLFKAFIYIESSHKSKVFSKIICLPSHVRKAFWATIYYNYFDKYHAPFLHKCANRSELPSNIRIPWSVHYAPCPHIIWIRRTARYTLCARHFKGMWSNNLSHINLHGCQPWRNILPVCVNLFHRLKPGTVSDISWGGRGAKFRCPWLGYPKNSSSTSGPTTKREGVKAGPLRKKKLFWSSTPLSSGEGLWWSDH